MRVHHIEILCRDIKLQVHNFCTNYGFAVYGRWKDLFYGGKEKLVLKRDPIYFVIHEDEEASCDCIQNIALEVENVAGICESIPRDFVAEDVTTIEEGCKHCFTSDSNHLDKQFISKIEAALVRSPIGNLHHTLLDKSNYNGSFLPNFSLIDTLTDTPKCVDPIARGDQVIVKENGFHRSSNNPLLLDHITYAVDTGTSFDHMEWYSKYLQMARCKVNDKEESDGFKVETLNTSGEKLGLKLTAMQYHFCSEQSLKLLPHNDIDNGNVKVVFAESLLGQGPNQVDTFIKENGGPGVQHIGLLSNDIFTSVEEWTSNDVSFIKPPQHYYQEIDDKLQQINENGLRQLLEYHGVLLDTEETEGETGKLKYLLQVFTKPIFSKETFFFELIQRHGATGFGAGNISALWRAVDAYLREQSKFS